MPKPTTVWLVRPETGRARRGTLSLEQGLLTFAADDGEHVPMRLIERARRLRGTPVLEVTYRAGDERRSALFYFVEPPPVPERVWAPAPSGVLGQKGMLRTAAILRLRMANRMLKPVIKEWVREIRG